MGNPDLVVIINGKETILIKGTEYTGFGAEFDEVFLVAIVRHREYIKKLKSIADFPDQIDDRIRKIEIFEIDLG